MIAQTPTVLLVDDEASIHDMLGLILREAGYFVDAANDGLEGLRKFRGGSWDLVITDLSMPAMGGEELAQEIRAIPSNVPIILITGFLKPKTRQDLFDEILEKPFSESDLLTIAAKVLARTARR